jgi:zinc transporter ZupT
MNYKMLCFAGMVTMTIGIGLGIILASLFPTPYRGGLYREQKLGFIIVGAAGGLLAGISQEAIRQLKQKQDQE